MRDKVLKLCRRLKKCTLNDLVSLTEEKEDIVSTALLYLENKGNIEINLIEKGFDFIGYVIKPNRMFLRVKTVNKSLYEIKKWHDLPNKFSECELEKLRSKANGYLGLANRCDNFNYRKKLCEEISGNLFIKADEGYRKIIKMTK